MRATTRAALAEINRRFYELNADEFARSRSAAWPGWGRVLERWTSRAGDSSLARVLDLGCGNGRIWPSLWSRVQDVEAVVGLDLSLPLLRRARGLARASGETAVCVRADCFGEFDLPVRSGGFDLVTLFGAAHHIPSFEQRSRVLARAMEAVRPGGLLAATFWRRAVLSRKRTIAWQAYVDHGAVTLDPSDLEPGDYLLGWGSTGERPSLGAVRYCHLFDELEVDACKAALGGVSWSESFNADGPGGEDNRYLIVQKVG